MRRKYMTSEEKRLGRNRIATAFYHKHKTRLREQRCAYQRQLYVSRRAELLAAYGAICTCCGETQQEFLTLEHLNGDGAEHKRRVGRGLAIYNDLRARGYPKDAYTLLCMNCNHAKRAGKTCPHWHTTGGV